MGWRNEDQRQGVWKLLLTRFSMSIVGDELDRGSLSGRVWLALMTVEVLERQAVKF